MKNLNIREMRSRLSDLDELLAKEGEIVVTRRGKPIARVVSYAAPVSMPSHADLRARMKPLSVPSAVHIRADRDA